MTLYRVTLVWWSDTLVGLTSIWEFPGLVGNYCSYLLPKQYGGTPQIYVNPTKVSDHYGHPLHCAGVILSLSIHLEGPLFLSVRSTFWEIFLSQGS